MRRDERFYDTRLADALHLAAESFAHVERKGSGIPYLSHLLAVTTIVMEHGGTPDQCIAAVLHDYIEDIDGATPDELTARFGANVTHLVLALSDTTREELDGTGKKPPWEQRKQRYLAHLEHASAEVKLISAADKLHNASSIVRDRERIGDAIYERFTPTREQTLWYYRSVVDALGTGWDHALLDELRRVVDALHDR